MFRSAHFRPSELLLGIVVMLVSLFPRAAVSLPVQQTPRSPAAERAQEFQKDREAGKKYLSAGKPSLAIPFLEEARSINSSDFDNGCDLAEAYRLAGELEQARLEALHALTIRNTPDVHTLLGNIATDAHSPKDAASEYQIAAQMDPSEDRIFDFGKSLIGFESDAALKIFSYGLEKFPNSALLRIGLGAYFDVHGDYEKAAEALCQATDLDPDDPRPIDFLGKLLTVSPETTEQIDLRFTRFLKTHPNSAHANYYLGRDLLDTKDGLPSPENLAKGEQLLQTAIRLDPNLADAYFELGRLRERQGQKKEAVLAYEQAVKLDPNQGKYHYRLLMAYRAIGESEKAKRESKIFQQLQAAEDEKYGPKAIEGSPAPND